MNVGPGGPDWGQASDGLWDPAYTHPDYQTIPTEQPARVRAQPEASRNDVKSSFLRLIRKPEGVVGLAGGFVVGVGSAASNPAASPLAAVAGFGIGYGATWIARRAWERKSWPRT